MKKATKKRAEIPSTVFVYALAAVIVAMILIFGYKSIGKLTSTVSKTETAKFKADLKNIIIEDTSYGKNNLVELRMPTGFEELCFIAARKSIQLSGNDILKKYPFAQDVADSSNNVFLADAKGNIDTFTVDPFEIDPSSSYGTSAFCIKQRSGRVVFRIKGKGDVALIVNATS